MLFRNDLVDQNDPVLAAHTAVANGALVPQHDVELLLGEYCARLGVQVYRGIEVHGVRSTGADLLDDVDVVVETSAGDFTAGWVVAADGGRSVIRKQLGIDFVGTEPQLMGYQAIADFDDPSELTRGWTWTPRGVYTYGPIPGRILVGQFGPQPADREAPVSLEELQRVVREVTGTQVTLNGLQGPGDPVVGQCPAGPVVPAWPGLPRGRRRARALAVQRSGPEPPARRRGESWLETRRNQRRLGAGRAARHLPGRTAQSAASCAIRSSSAGHTYRNGVVRYCPIQSVNVT
jgi:hypothetical protein